MIHFTDLRHLNAVPADERHIIVRSLKKPIAGATQMTALSPSQDLFRMFLGLKECGQWNHQAFEELYVPRFLKQIHRDREARKILNDLFAKDRDGLAIVLACYCTDEGMCHRSIIAGLLQGAGAQVSAEDDYSRYFAMYRSLPGVSDQ